MPSATASGRKMRRCSRMTRRASGIPWSWSATWCTRRQISAFDHRLEKSLFVGLFLKRRNVLESVGFLERLDEGIEILRAARLYRHADDEAPVGRQSRLHRGDPDVGRQRLFESTEELGPGKRALIDDAVRLTGGAGH